MWRVSPTCTLAVSKRLTDTAGRTSHVDLVSRPRQCRHSITSGILNIFLFRLKFVFIKHRFCSVLLYASETWTSIASHMKTIESFHIKYQRRILGIRWHDFVRNSEVSLRTGLAPVSDRITRGRNAIFGHVARLPDNTPAHQAMLRQVELSVGRPPDPTWKCPAGHHVPNGPTNSAAITTMFPLRLCGGKPFVAVTRERRYGPSRLRVNDDDDESHRQLKHQQKRHLAN